MEHLFVYGTLGPGRPNEYVLKSIGGEWESATVTGRLRNEGWGSEQGYPGLDLDNDGVDIDGFIFSSKNLSSQWSELDEFEGDGYERVLTNAKLRDGSIVEANVYRLRSNSTVERSLEQLTKHPTELGISADL